MGHGMEYTCKHRHPFHGRGEHPVEEVEAAFHSKASIEKTCPNAPSYRFRVNSKLLIIMPASL